MFQKGGAIWGIGTRETTLEASAKDNAERDADFNIDREYMLYDSVTDCPPGDYVVMKCSRNLYEKVQEKRATTYPMSPIRPPDKKST